MKLLLTILSLSISCAVFAQRHTISGYITDEGTGETLIGASVFEQNGKKGAASNAYGFYSLTLPQGAVSLECAFVGYTPISLGFQLNKDTVINFLLTQSNLLQEVTVVGQRVDMVRGTQMSTIDIPVAQIKSVPALLGEVDVIKALQLLPGVQSGTEGTAGFYVRGGGPDENLILLDEIPIYNANHALGFFSVFNADALKSVTLYKGSFPARFGERLSSVVDIRMKDGNNSGYHGNVSVGLIASKITFEGPIKDKTTFSISGRRTYFDILTQPFIKMASESEGLGSSTAGYYFYDLNAKVSHKFSEKDRLYLSFYTGDDGIYARMKEDDYSGYNEDNDQEYRYESSMKMNWKWGNLITALRWNHVINNKLFMNTTAAFSRYRFFLDMSENYTETYRNKKETTTSSVGYHSGISDYLLKSDFDFKPNTNHDVRFGLNFISHQFRPDVISAKERTTGNIDHDYDPDFEPFDFSVNNKPVPGNELSLYAEDDWLLSSMFRVNVGARYSTFLVQKRFYHSIQPRAAVRAMLSSNLSVKAGYSYMSQYIHLLSNSSISLPTDLWVPVTKRIAPMNTHQISVGTFYNLKKTIDFSAEIYYKTMNNLLEYKDGSSFFGVSTGWEDKVNVGRGWSYGLELMVQKSVGKTTGWVAYTWAKSERLFDRVGQEVNFGRVFPAKFDRRHDISITLSHKFSTKIDMGATWVFSTGNAASLALQNYNPGTVPDAGNRYWYDDSMHYYSSRNNYRMPSYHRLDLGINFHKKKKHGTRTWNISIYNVYNQQNPFVIYEGTKGEYVNNNGNWRSHKVLKQLSIFPIIPSVSYIYAF